MTILSVVIVLCVVGVLLYLVNQYLPMQPPFKTIVNVVVVIAVVLWVLSAFGVLGSISGARLPRVRCPETIRAGQHLSSWGRAAQPGRGERRVEGVPGAPRLPRA